jgi:hypothetical protein
MEERQIKDVDAIRRFMLAGLATFTLRSKPTGKRYTFKVARYEPGRYNVNLLVGPDQYSRIGWFDGTGFHAQITGSALLQACAAFQWFIRARPAKIDEQVEFWHAGRCARCGRELTVPESIESGFGPECARKIS